MSGNETDVKLKAILEKQDKILAEFRGLIMKNDAPWYFLVLPAQKAVTVKNYDLHLLCNGTNESSPHFLVDESGTHSFSGSNLICTIYLIHCATSLCYIQAI